MLVVISPAKSLELSKPIDCTIATIPVFDIDKQAIVDKLKKLSIKSIEKKFDLSLKLAQLNYDRYQALGTNDNLAQSRQGIFTFSGEVYVGFDAFSLDVNQFDFTQNTIRILSGLYGILKPFDLIEPYRLEMGSDISIGRKKNLYQYWSDMVTHQINETESEWLINLASQEYFKAINPKKLKAKILNIDFLEDDEGKFKNISFFSKKARGLMTRYIVDHMIKTVDEIRYFDKANYQFNSSISSEDKFVFTRKSMK